MDEKAVEPNVKAGDFGNEWLKMHSAGSGPFKMRVYQPHQAIVLDANPTSPGDAPKVKNIIIKNVPDPAARRLLIQQGDADIARDLGSDQTSALEGKPGVKVLSIPSAEQNYLVFNVGKQRQPAAEKPGAVGSGSLPGRLSGHHQRSAERPVLRSPELPAGRLRGRAGKHPVQI
ncbi:glutathione ABC transporter substrate-binding protein GsiB [Cedecea neteri]|uniref:Glutathione ABC transporter substrate-binding protein GsiB n=1 Tax=Cedecea neteri TaxID=158822 RepID=A0A2X2TE55_9ENTR|nr:glutathione ABC transporter substrate-binding protein GsiB [Cedecea neteri]